MAQCGQRFAAPADILAWLEREGLAFSEQFQIEESTGNTRAAGGARHAELAAREVAIAVVDADLERARARAG